MSVAEVTEPVENAKAADESARTIASTGAFPVANRSAVWRALRQLVSRHRRPMIITTCLLWLAAAAGLVGPWLLGRIVDDLAHGGTAWTVGLLAGGMLVALLAQAGFTYEANRRTQRLGADVVAELREQFIESVVRLPLSTVEAAGTGDLLTRTTRDVRTVSDTVRFGIPQTSIAAITIIATFVASLFASGLLTLAMTVAVPPLVAIGRWYLRRSTPAYAAVGAAHSALNQVTSSNAEGARTIDALSLADIRTRAADDAIRTTFRATVRTAMLRTVLFPVTNFAFSMQVMATLLWGGWLAARGYTTAGAVATVTLYAVQLGPPVEQLIRWLDNLQSSGASLARLLGVGEVPPDRIPTGARPQGSTIELRDVTFEYEPGRPVLHGVSLTLRPGERLAIVGPSGSGKSTLARLIAGVDAPKSGTATVGGVPLMSLPLDRLRREVALATQEQHVFQGTIAENVRLGRADATDAELVDALAAVGAGWVLDLPDGLETPIGAGAHQLTPARAQHIALARLVLLDPHTLVLDEATALLDPTAARSLESSMALAMRGRTIAAIAHRLHTARDADRIAVIVDGRLAELGSHDDLLASDGPYARLWRTWRESD